ncbi:Tetratricopeptide repeat protein [Bremerella volcania]|uniref:Tetratricopeptide repeat protein n=1 Tax=Bremerella volcania TaxID=2527984 RepID=A0A518C787_9BACT|nr:tetratricopeptide repeat protein [Bremerella volcania]QDU75064.1 Tetratricopeptide repeat protein [Bremerella volcania]
MSKRLVALLILTALAAQSIGCAISPTIREAFMDPGKEQRERKEEINRLVDQRHVQTRLQAASAMLDSGRYTDCERVLAEIEKIDPNCKEMYLIRGESLMAQNKFAQAAALYEKVLLTHPADANLHHLHAMALEFSGDSVAAMLAFQRAAELSPDSSLIQLSQIRADASGTTSR